MNDSIKYKQSEIGSIPKEWSVKQLKDVMDVYRGGSPRPIQNFLTNSSNGINWIKIGDVDINAKYIDTTEEKIIEKGAQFSRKITAGDFLLSNSMSYGRPYISRLDGCIHDGWLVLQNYKKYFDQEYLYYILSSKLVIDQYLQKAAGSSVLNLNKELVSSINLLMPSLNEQSIIASVLSDLDKLITKLEILISKKKAVKQGVIQKLLTGRKRLPGFSGEWKQIVFGKNAILKARIGWQGLTTSEYREEGEYYLITGTEFEDGQINWGKCFFVDKKRYDQDTNIQVKKEDVLITKDGTIGKVAYIHKLSKPATLNSGVFVIRPINKSFSPLFLFYILQSEVFSKFLSQLSAGSTINHLYQKNFVNFSFNAPPSNEEQIAISEIISSMDDEIRQLEKILKKYTEVKTGMMQQLLTGKIRIYESN